MKTERMTLLISPADKAAITARAASLGMSVSELVRTAAMEFDPEYGMERERLEALLTEIDAALDRVETNVSNMLDDFESYRATMAHQASPEYREQIRREVLADPTIDWSRIQKLLQPIATMQEAA